MVWRMSYKPFYFWCASYASSFIHHEQWACCHVLVRFNMFCRFFERKPLILSDTLSSKLYIYTFLVIVVLFVLSFKMRIVLPVTKLPYCVLSCIFWSQVYKYKYIFITQKPETDMTERRSQRQRARECGRRMVQWFSCDSWTTFFFAACGPFSFVCMKATKIIRWILISSIPLFRYENELKSPLRFTNVIVLQWNLARIK